MVICVERLGSSLVINKIFEQWVIRLVSDWSCDNKQYYKSYNHEWLL